MSSRTPGPWKAVARRMFDADGRPDWSGPGTAGRWTYESAARDVLDALDAMGYRIIKRGASRPPKRKATK